MDIVDVTAHKGEFFRVLQQTGRDAGPAETHGGDQIVYIVEGEAVITVGKDERRTGPGSLVMIPAGARHHVRNAGGAPLFFLTVYAPPEY
jgi:mannose-6-phosphate isomerase-like protein (cupin superfamily)